MPLKTVGVGVLGTAQASTPYVKFQWYWSRGRIVARPADRRTDGNDWAAGDAADGRAGRERHTETEKTALRETRYSGPRAEAERERQASIDGSTRIA